MEKWRSWVNSKTGRMFTIYQDRQVTWGPPDLHGKRHKGIRHRKDHPDETDAQWWTAPTGNDWEEVKMAQFEAVEKFGPYKSSSGSGQYWVQLNKNGIISCNCKGWTMYKGRPRSCKHTDQVIREKGWQNQLKIPNGSQYIFLSDKQVNAVKTFLRQTPEETLQALINAYEKAVEFMSRQPLDKVIEAAMAVEEAKFKIEVYVAGMKAKGVALNLQMGAA